MFSTIVAASTFAGLAAAAPVANSFASAAKSMTTFGPFTATHFYSTEYKGSCGYTNRTNQYIVSIATNKTSESACGKTVNITSLWNGDFVLAQVVDEREHVPSSYLNLSRVAFEAVHPITYENFTATYTFSDEKVPSYVPVSYPTNDDEPAQPEQKHEDSKPTTSEKEDEKPQYTSTSSSSEKAEYTPSSSSKKAEWTPTTSSEKAEWTPEHTTSSSSSSKKAEYTPKTTSEKPEWTPEAKQEEPKQTQQSQSQSSGGSSGTVTYFYQGGNPGACGSVNSDSAYIAAVSPSQYGGGSACGRNIRISANGNTITVRVADLCPSCSYGHIDLSTGAFSALGSFGAGVLNTQWSWA